MMYHGSIIVSNAVYIKKTSLPCLDPRSPVLRIESPYRVTTRREPLRVLCWLVLVGVLLVAHPLVVGAGVVEVEVEAESVAELAELAELPGQAGQAGQAERVGRVVGYTGVDVVERD